MLIDWKLIVSLNNEFNNNNVLYLVQLMSGCPRMIIIVKKIMIFFRITIMIILIFIVQAIGKNSFYLGEVGNASKMNLVLQVSFIFILYSNSLNEVWIKIIYIKTPFLFIFSFCNLFLYIYYQYSQLLIS